MEPSSDSRPGPATSRRRLLGWLAAALVVVVLAGVAVAALAARGLKVEEAAPSPAVRAARQGEAQEALDRAAAALQRGDRAAYDAALPAEDVPAAKARAQLFARLAPLPWSSFAFSIEPVPGRPGRFDVFAVGGLGRTGPADRIAGNRVLEFAVRQGRVVLTGDVTPPVVRRQYLMAFARPVAVQRPGGVVIADRSWRPLAVKLADDLATARRRIAAAGIRPGGPVVVYLYASMGQLRASLADHPSETRMRFFSMPVERMLPRRWSTRDVGVLGPELAGQDAWRPMMLAHELTHAYTMHWFAHTEHAPTLLAEGIATMVEGGRSFEPLRQDLAAARPRLPLLTAIALGSLWSGNSTDKVHLAYLEGASLVGYVVDRWGIGALRPWVQAVADSDLSREGLDAATRSTLGIGWGKLEAGWRQYVYTLP